MNTERKHYIKYVASLIWDAMMIMSAEEAAQHYRAANEREGFTIEYIPPGLPRGNWLRVEGVRLFPEEMEEAIFLANKWFDVEI
jgi:hypothetical protein